MEDAAVTEIRGLSENARRHLQHRLRDGLQSVVSCIETGAPETAVECALSMADELRRLGL